MSQNVQSKADCVRTVYINMGSFIAGLLAVERTTSLQHSGQRSCTSAVLSPPQFCCKKSSVFPFIRGVLLVKWLLFWGEFFMWVNFNLQFEFWALFMFTGTVVILTRKTDISWARNCYFRFFFGPLKCVLSRPQWPFCLRRRSTAPRLLRFWISVPPGHGCLSVLSVVCCQVEVSATNWSLVQRSPTDCGTSLCVIWKPRKLGVPGPLGTLAPNREEKEISLNCYAFCYHDVCTFLALTIMLFLMYGFLRHEFCVCVHYWLNGSTCAILARRTLF